MKLQLFCKRAFQFLLLGLIVSIFFALEPTSISMLKSILSLKNISLILFAGILQALILGMVILYSKWRGIKLIITVSILYYYVCYFTAQVESVIFLNQLVDILSIKEIIIILIHGLYSSVIVVTAAVFIFNKFKNKPNEVENENYEFKMTIWNWTWKISTLSILYMVVYTAFGALVFVPIAGDAFNKYYKDLQMPLWVFPFQIIRGAAWVIVSVYLHKLLKCKLWLRVIIISGFLSVIITSQLLPASTAMPFQIRMAHFVEVFTSMVLFGFITSLLIRPKKI